MHIVYYTGALIGIGRLVHGIAIGNALARKKIDCKFTIVHSSNLVHIINDFHQIKIPLENESELSLKHCHKSVLFKTLKKLKPDILLVNHQWFMLYNFIDELNCNKIYLSDQAYDSHFRIPMQDVNLVFNARQYDRIFSIEPFISSVAMECINPLIIRNRDEILDRNESVRRLGLNGNRKIALYSFSLNPETYDRFLKKYAYLDEEYEVVHTSTFGSNLFPVVDYFNAIDLIICGGGYNQVWEVVYFNKKAIFEPLQVLFSDQAVRIETSRNFHFTENGADQLVDKMMNM